MRFHIKRWFSVRVRFLGESTTSYKKKQLEIIQNTNPMWDDYHVGIRTLSDIKDAKFVFSKNGWSEDEPGNTEAIYPDWTFEMAQEALRKGKLVVYSSKPIVDGNFVTPSKMNAKCYGTQIYQQVVNLDDIAWINSEEGQVARVRKLHESVELDESVRVLENDRIHQSINSYLKRIKGLAPHFRDYFDDYFADYYVITLRPQESSIYLSDEELGLHCYYRNILIVSGVRRTRSSGIYMDFIEVYRASERLEDGLMKYAELIIKHKDTDELNQKASEKVRGIVRDLSILIDDNRKLTAALKSKGFKVYEWTVKDGIDPGFLKKKPKNYVEED